MDYEQLLRKYIEHVRQYQGIDGIDAVNMNYGSDVRFTEDEISSLKRLASPETGKGCGRALAPGHYWAYCGETDMGQSLPALCTECGGEYKLA